MSLPRPDVEVTSEVPSSNGGAKVNIKVSRDSKSATHEGSGNDSNAATAEAVKKLLGDPKTAEWLP